MQSILDWKPAESRMATKPEFRMATTWPHKNSVVWAKIKVVSYPGLLSSQRAKRAGPKGLRAESARAVTGRRCPHSEKGEGFLTGQPDFFTERAVTPERKVEKSFPRWEINCHGEG